MVFVRSAMKLGLLKKKVTQEDVGTMAMFPYTLSDLESFQTLKNNTVHIANVRKPRNVKQFHKYWALCRLVAASAVGESFEDERQVSTWLLFKTKMVDTIVVSKDISYIRPFRINWESMGQEEFEYFYKKAMPIVAEELQCSEEDIKENVVFYM